MKQSSILKGGPHSGIAAAKINDSAMAASRATKTSWLGRTLLRAAAAAALAMSAAHAAPVTVYFSGEIEDYLSLSTSTYLPTNGATFSGYMTFDLANATSHSNTPAINGYQSKSGCLSYTNAMCDLDFGTHAPLVTNWHWESNVGAGLSADRQPFAGGYEESNVYRINYPGNSPDLAEYRSSSIFEAHLPQGGEVALGRSLALRGSMANAPLFDLTDMASPLPFDLYFVASIDAWSVIPGCTQNCAGLHSDDSFFLTGRVTSLSFVQEAATVPEPGSLALVGLGLAGIVALRRRSPAPSA